MYREAGPSIQTAPKIATSRDGSASRICVTGCPASSWPRCAAVSFTELPMYASSRSGSEVGGERP